MVFIYSEIPFWRFDGEVIELDEDDFDYRGCRIAQVSPGTAARLRVENCDMVEYVGRAPAPLRAWAQIREIKPHKGLPIGPIGRRILKVGPSRPSMDQTCAYKNRIPVGVRKSLIKCNLS